VCIIIAVSLLNNELQHKSCALGCAGTLPAGLGAVAHPVLAGQGCVELHSVLKTVH